MKDYILTFEEFISEEKKYIDFDNIKDNYSKYKILRDVETYDDEGNVAPKRVIEPQKDDKIYFYIEKEFYKDKN